MIIEFLLLIVFICFLYVSLASLPWVNAKRRSALYWSDLCLPIVLLLFWIFLASIGYGHQSLSNLIEIPISLIVGLLLLYVRVFIVDRYSKQFKQNSYIILGLCLFFVLLLRTFMPFFPE
ncbi:hypothetical protein [Photobacterium toruni]|uniref:hypothetical protein n=1 Tax=Photobacterium toruni TaxID=1935446 RepID=UPI00210F8725|nr:hypothetical protein [Photobacterium toruni]MEC6814550.1 hypothetical protein [Photobacterium toruni]